MGNNKRERRQRLRKSPVRLPNAAPPRREEQQEEPLPVHLRLTDVIMSIPVVDVLFSGILILFVKLCDLLLFHWRTKDKAISEFLALPPRQHSSIFHLHIYARKSLAADGYVFFMGIDVASRYGLFLIPANITDTDKTLLPRVIKELCQSVIRANQDHSYRIGRPYLITTPDYKLYIELTKKFANHGTIILHKPEKKVMVGSPSSNGPIPLSAITDAHATTMDRNSGLLLRGQNLPENVTETYRASKSRPGTSRSTVQKKNDSVPRSIEFCCSCAKLFLRDTLSLCSKCEGPAYCSAPCQSRDWKEGPHPHRRICKLMRDRP